MDRGVFGCLFSVTVIRFYSKIQGGMVEKRRLALSLSACDSSFFHHPALCIFPFPVHWPELWVWTSDWTTVILY